MIDDVRPPDLRQRKKPKVIEPLPQEPKTPLHELVAAHDAKTAAEAPNTPATSENNEPSSLAAADTANEAPFSTPEQTAAHDEPAATPIVSKTSRRLSIHRWFQPPYSRKQKIIGIAAAVVLLAGGGAGGWLLMHHKSAPVSQAPKKQSIKKVAPPAPIYSNLSGLQITDASLNQKPVTAVMIENSIDARPQSGLGDAGVVFEAIAEGGVTRFMALFQDTTPTNVGPIRSARPYYIQWALGFDAAYAHVGGSPDALDDIKSWHVKDMNQFYNGGYYHRVSSRDAPHNVYTGIDTLNQLEAKDGYTSTFTGFARKSDQPYKAPSTASAAKTSSSAGSGSSGPGATTPQDTRTPASSIDFSLSGYTYDPHYDYDAASNSYLRSEAGEKHMDANTNTQLHPKVVVAIVVPLARGALDSSGAYYSDYNPIGSGTAYVFQDGTVTTGKWSKPDNNSALTFTTDTGTPLQFNRGQTWITAVSSTSGVAYK